MYIYTVGSVVCSIPQCGTWVIGSISYLSNKHSLFSATSHQACHNNDHTHRPLSLKKLPILKIIVSENQSFRTFCFRPSLDYALFTHSKHITYTHTIYFKTSLHLQIRAQLIIQIVQLSFIPYCYKAAATMYLACCYVS